MTAIALDTPDRDPIIQVGSEVEWETCVGSIVRGKVIRTGREKILLETKDRRTYFAPTRDVRVVGRAT